MQGLILAGGLGTRLRKAVSDRPKPMALIRGKPFLYYQINYLKHQGFKEIILCLGYQAEKVIDFFKDGAALGLRIRYSVELFPLGTGGAIKNAESMLSQEFFVLNGDTFIPIEYKSFWEHHQKSGNFLTMLVTQSKSEGNSYGNIIADDTGKIVDFREKEQVENAYLNAGVYACSKEILNFIQRDRYCSLEKEIIPKIKRSVGVYLSQDLFYDFGTTERYQKIQREWSEIYDLSK